VLKAVSHAGGRSSDTHAPDQRFAVRQDAAPRGAQPCLGPTRSVKRW